MQADSIQINVEDISTVKKKMSVEVFAQNVAVELDKAYNELKKNAKVKGFRQGKTPRSVLSRLYGKNVHADVSTALIQESFALAIQETGLNIIGKPEINPQEIDEKGPFKYDATIEVNPEIEDIDFKGMKLTKNIYTVEEEHVEAQLKMIQTKQTQTQKIEEERPVQAKDTVLIDFEGFIDDKPLEQLPKTENFVIKIGESTIIKELDDALIGTQPGEHKDIPVTFPEDFQVPELAGKDVLIKADIKEIREEILPDINDEFAKELGEKYETLEDLKADIRKNIEEGNAKRTEQELNEQIFTALLDQVEFEVPDIWVQNELDNMVADVERKFGNNREVMEQSGITREVIENEYRGIAVSQAQRHLILDKIINQEKLELTDEKLEKSYEDIAKQYQQPVEQIRTLYASKPEMVEFLRHTLLEKEALSLIFDNSTIEEMAQENTESEETAE